MIYVQFVRLHDTINATDLSFGTFQICISFSNITHEMMPYSCLPSKIEEIAYILSVRNANADILPHKLG